MMGRLWFFYLCIIIGVGTLFYSAQMQQRRAEKAERALGMCTLTLTATTQAIGVRP